MPFSGSPKLRVWVLVGALALLAALGGRRWLSSPPVAKGDSAPHDGRTAVRPTTGVDVGSAEGRLHIQVLHARDGSRIPQASLEGGPENAPPEDVGASDAQGRFEARLSPGTYRFRAQWGNAAPSEWKAVKIVARSTQDLVLSLGQGILTVVRGRVRTVDGQEVGDARVILTYDRDRQVPGGVADLLGEENPAVAVGDGGAYEIRRELHPWTYELYAAGPFLDPVRDPPVLLALPDRPGVAVRTLDLSVRSVPTANIEGRLVGPSGQPVRDAALLIQRLLVDENGQEKGYLESKARSGPEGGFRFRTAHERVRILVSHPEWSTRPVNVRAEIENRAGQIQRIPDVQLALKDAPVELRFRLSDGTLPVPGSILLNEHEPNPRQIVSFGNSSHPLELDREGSVPVRLDSAKVYSFHSDAYVVDGVEGAASATPVKGVFAVPQGGGSVVVTLRRR